MSTRVTFKLCFATDRVLYFTDDMENVNGEDWFGVVATEALPPIEDGISHLRYVGYVPTKYDIESNDDKFSVVQINAKRAAWLWSESAGGLYAGATVDEAIDWLHKSGAVCAELF